jgi:2,4-dienoyl-CoA reductase-like NADH-dependent reductase (Old Yellow Enzyme family)
MALTRIFEPIRIGSVEIPNRIMQATHATGLAGDGKWDDWLDYYVARAKGGCGLSILESASIHPSSSNSTRFYDGSYVPHLKRLTKAVHPYGMRLFQQLFLGGNIDAGPGRAPSYGVSSKPGAYGHVPYRMTKDDIAEITEAYATAAAYSQEGGLDGIEIHAAHGFLIHQFISPNFNDRADEYGGPLENRMRFLKDILRAIRNRTGSGFAIGARFSTSSAPGGVTQAENKAIIDTLISEGLLDFVDTSMSDYYDNMAAMLGDMNFPTGYILPKAMPLIEGVKVPRIVGGRYRTLEDAEQVLKEGVADLVSMVRAQIADPNLIAKSRAGRALDVRPCIGCNQGCIGGVMRERRLGCTVNPTAGWESTLSEDLITPLPNPKSVFIIGGGPAGMEAARVAALMGCRVTLAEASPDLGGAAAIAARAARLANIGDIVLWLKSEVYRLGVDVRPSTYIDPEDIATIDADYIVIATGSQPRMDGFQMKTPGLPAEGCGLPHVLSSTDLLTDPHRSLGKTALVLDTVGHVEGEAVAEYLIDKGLAVTFVTPHPSFAPQLDPLFRDIAALERLYQGEFEVLVRHHLSAIARDHCIVRPLQAPATKQRIIPADTVVLVTQNEPMRELYDILSTKRGNIILIGDALAPRDLQIAITDGHRKMRAALETVNKERADKTHASGDEAGSASDQKSRI